ncbi:MAG: radical SAM protein [Candidatus Omnitrophota bacterium]
MAILTTEQFKATAAYKNAVLNIEEARQKKQVLQSYPFRLFVEPTQRCDLDCIMCWPKRRQDKKEMPLELFQKIEKELFPYASEVNLFLVGEPTMAVNFPKMAETCAKYDFLPKIFTNAVNTKEGVIRMLVELGFFVNISLDAATPALYEKIRRGAEFTKVIANIEKYISFREKIKNPRFHIRIATTCSPFNIDEVPKIMEFLKARGINDIFLNNCDMGVFQREFQLSAIADKAYKVFTEAEAFADANKIRFSCQKRIGGIELEKNNNWDDFSIDIDQYAMPYLEKYNPYRGKCPYPWMGTIFRTDGTVMSCCQGNIKMGKYAGGDFRTIWNNEKYQALRARKSYYHCGMTRNRWYCNMTRTSVHQPMELEFNPGLHTDWMK